MVKRPMIYMTAAYAIGILSGDNRFVVCVAVFLCLGILIYMYRKSKIFYTSVFLCPVMILLGAVSYIANDKMPDIDKIFEEKQKVSMAGRVYSIQDQGDIIAIVLKDVKVSLNKKGCIKQDDETSQKDEMRQNDNDRQYYDIEGIIVYMSSEEDVRVGNVIGINTDIEKFEHATNPGQFDAYNYYVKQQKLYYRAFANKYYKENEIKDISLLVKKNIVKQSVDNLFYSIKSHLYRLRNTLKEIINNVYKDKSGIICAMLLGEKNLIDSEVKEMYMENGIAHVLAISGLHISIIGAALYRLLLKTGLNLYIASYISIVVIILYGIMTDFGTSTNRAVVMLIIMIIARCFGRTYDAITTIALSALIILIQNPFSLFSIGFLLSFLSVIGVIVINPMLSGCIIRKIKKVKTKENRVLDKETGEIVEEDTLDKNVLINNVLDSVKKSLVAGVSINIVTLPVTLYAFYEVPIFSIILNIIVVPLMTIVMASAIAVCILGFINNSLAIFAGGCSYYILCLYEKMCNLVSKITINSIITGKPDTIKIILYYIVVIIFALISYIKTRKASYMYKNVKSAFICIIYKKIRRLAINPAYILILCFLILVPKINNYDELVMLDIGQGDCIYARARDRTTFMFDCGSSDEKNIVKYKVEPFLKSKGITGIDYMFISHMDSDHISGIYELYDNKIDIKIKRIIIPYINEDEKTEPYKEFEDYAYKNNIRLSYIKEDDIIADNNWNLECLCPNVQMKYTTENEYSMCATFRMNKLGILFCGDVEKKGEDELISNLVSKNICNIEVLKVAHHGSSMSTDKKLLEFIKPKYALISAGKNNSYGHPHEETIKKLEAVGSNISVTSHCGAITLHVNKRLEINMEEYGRRYE